MPAEKIGIAIGGSAMFSLLVGSIVGTHGARRAMGAGLLAVALLALHGCVCVPYTDPDCDRPHSAVDPGKPSTDCLPKGNTPEFWPRC